MIKRNSKKAQHLSLISTQQPSELLYKGGSHNHSCPALKELQLQKKPSVGPPSRKGLYYTKKALLFSSPIGAVVRDQCEKLSIEVRLELFPYINLGRNLPLTPTARQTTRAPGCSSFTFSEERRAQKTSWLQAAPSLFFCPDFSASVRSPHPKSSCRL